MESLPTRRGPGRAPGWMLLAGLLVVALAGCGENKASNYAEAIDTYPVTGKVELVDGKPVTSGSVIFEPAGEAGRQAIGALKSDGTYELTTTRPGDGAAPGEYRVAVLPGPDSGIPAAGAKAKAKAKASKYARYADADASGLTATIKAEPNSLTPFVLK